MSFEQFVELWRSHIDKQRDEMGARLEEMRILFGEGLGRRGYLASSTRDEETLEAHQLVGSHGSGREILISTPSRTSCGSR